MLLLKNIETLTPGIKIAIKSQCEIELFQSDFENPADVLPSGRFLKHLSNYHIIVQPVERGELLTLYKAL